MKADSENETICEMEAPNLWVAATRKSLTKEGSFSRNECAVSSATLFTTSGTSYEADLIKGAWNTFAHSKVQLMGLGPISCTLECANVFHAPLIIMPARLEK